MSMNGHSCPICELRPRAPEQPYCNNCQLQIEADKRSRKALRHGHFLTYKGFVVGLVRNDRGLWTPEALKRSADKLPKGRTIDLNTFLPGYTREEIKRFKVAVLRTHHVR